MSKIMLANGRLFDLLDPDPKMIDLDMIAQSLCTQVRFNGHLPYFYTVGCHTVAMYSVAKVRGEAQSVLRQILIHDMPEFAVGDMVSPLKRQLGPEFGTIESKVMEACQAAFAYLPTPADIARCDQYDKDIWEVELMIAGHPWWWEHDDSVYHKQICAAVEKTMSMNVTAVSRAFRSACHLEFDMREKVH